MVSYIRGVYYDCEETRQDAINFSGVRCEACGHDRMYNAHVDEDPCHCGCRVDTFILEAVNKVAEEALTVWRGRVQRPNCGCPGHSMPGVRHVAACCDVPHVDQ